MVCSDSVSSEAGSAALVGDPGGRDPFLVFLTHSIYSAAGQRSDCSTLHWSQH